MSQTLLRRRHLSSAILSAAALAPWWRSTPARALPAASGKPILTVSGAIEVTNQSNEAAFDRSMLEALGTDTIVTSTPWYKGPVRFDGVRMETLMQAIGAKGTSVTAYALNDFTTKLPFADFARYHPILALKRDGEYMSVRDKGPLFIVYPYDSEPELKQQIYYNRSAWQIARLFVE